MSDTWNRPNYMLSLIVILCLPGCASAVECELECEDACYADLMTGEGECRQSCETIDDCRARGPYAFCADGVCWPSTPPPGVVELCDSDPPLASCQE